MNPVTSGHEVLADVVAKKAKELGGAPGIYLSHSQDKKKNPLDYDTKIFLAQTAFGRDLIKKSKARTILEVAAELQNQFKKLVVVAGSDRVKEFETLLNKYNGKLYTYDSIEVVSAGQRDPDADGAKGMSASKMRALAAADDFDGFKKGLPKKLQGSEAKVAFAAVRDGMGLTEDSDLDEALSREGRRKIGIAMRKNKNKIARARKKSLGKKADKGTLEKRARKQVINKLKTKFAKGRSLSDLSDKEKQALEKKVKKISNAKINTLVRKTLPDVKAQEKERLHGTIDKKGVNESFELYLQERKAEDPDVKDMPGSQPKGYYKGLSKKDKEARAKHFAKYAKSDDDNPASYKPAPGDEDAKTKPSKHTKKFKDMFGEASETDCAPKKRYHNLMASNGQVKFDKRFKLYKPKKETPDNVKEFIKAAKDLEESIDLMESKAKAALKNKAEKSGMPYSILKKVYDRGVAAWRTGHRPGTNPHQWGLARVNSFATKSKGTWGKADKDLADKVRSESVELDEARNYKHKADASHKVKATVCYIDPMTRQRKCDDVYFKSKMDALSFKDNVKGFPKGAEVEAIKEELDEKASGLKTLAKILAKTTKRDLYKKAIELVKKAAKEDPKRDLAYHAGKVVRKFNLNIDPIVLRDIVVEEGGAGDWGTDELTDKYKKDTPDA